MRPWLVHLLCWSALLLPVAVSHAQLSARMRENILQALPKYDPHATDAKPKAVAPADTPAPLSDEPVVQLPVFHVYTPRTPPDSDAWLTKEGRKEKALKEYQDSMTTLEWALNWWHIPFLTPSAQTRADAAHEDRQIATEVGRLNDLVDAISHLDSDGAKKLARDLDLSRHPSN